MPILEQNQPSAGQLPEVQLGIHGQSAPLHSHIAYFWETQAEFEDAAGFLELGLRALDFCVIFGAPGANERVCRVLEERGLDVQALEKAGRLAVLGGHPSVEPIMESIGSAFQHALERGAPLIRLLGNIGWRENQWPGDEELLAFESRVTEVAAQFPCVILCLYDVRTLPGFIVQRGGFENHPTVHLDDHLCPNPFYLKPAPYRERLASLSDQNAGRRLAEEAQRQMQRRFRVLTESSPVCVFYCDPQGLCTYVNERWCELAGIDRDHALGDQWLQAVHPEDREALLGAWRTALQSGAIFSSEYRFQEPGGRVRWVASHAVPEKDDTGAIVGWVGTLADITARREAEATLHTLNAELEKRVGERTRELSLAYEALQMEGRKRARSADAARRNQELFGAFMANLPGLAFIKDREGRYVYVNQETHRIIGIDPAQLLGKTDADIWDKTTAEQCAKSHRHVLETNSPIEVLETLPLADGPHELLVHKFPLHAVRGHPELVACAAVDITERRRAEEALRQSHQFSRATIDALAAHICVIDEHGVIVAVNQAWRDFAAANACQAANYAVGANYLEVCDRARGHAAEEAPVFAAGIRSVMRGEHTCFSLEYPCHAPSNRRWFIARVTRFACESPLCLVIAHENITERKLAEEALRQSEERFRLTLKSYPIVAATKDTELRTTWVYNLPMGLKETDVLGYSEADYLEAEEAAKFLSLYRRVLQSGTGAREEIQTTYHGIQTVFDMAVEPIRDAENRLTGLTVVAADITAHKRAEDALARHAAEIRDLYERAPCGYYSVNAQGLLVEINETALRWLGYSRQEVLGRMRFRDLLAPEDVERYWSAFETFKQTGHILSLELEIRRKDGSSLPVILNASAIQDAAGQFLRSRSTLSDITERKMAERKISEAFHKEAVLRREIHHRVKNNLQVISSLLYLQSTKVSDPTTLEVLRESRSRARSIALIHDLLFQHDNLTRIDFAEYVHKLAGDLFIAYRIPPGSITLGIHGGQMPMGLDAAIPCGLILTELVSNALKHAFPGGRPGEIHVHLQAGAHERCALSVTDNGVGLPEGFDPANSPTMGLNLVRDLTGQLGGSLHFHPLQPGFRVEITFPNPEGAAADDKVTR